MKPMLWNLVAGALALTLASGALAQTNLEETIPVRDEALNTGDVGMAVSFYADEATYSVIFGPDQEPLVLNGKPAIAERLTQFVEDNVRYEATVWGVIGQTVRAFTTWSSDGMRASGIAYVEMFEEFVFEEGRIVEHTISVIKRVPLEEP